MQRRVLGFVFHRRKVSAFSLGEKKNTHPTTKKTPPLLKMESNTNWSLWLKAPSLKKSLVIHWLLTAGGWGLNKPSQQHVNFGEDAPHFPGFRGLCLQGHLGPPGPPFSCHPRGEQPLPPVGPRRGQCPIEGLRMPSIPTGPLCAAPLLRLLLPFPPSPNLSLFSDGVFPEQSLSLQPPPLRCHHAWLGSLAQLRPRPSEAEGRRWAVPRVRHKINHKGDSNTQMLNRLLTQGWRPVSCLWSRFLDKGSHFSLLWVVGFSSKGFELSHQLRNPICSVRSQIVCHCCSKASAGT